MYQWLTAYLASKTSWPEDYILNLPLYKVLLYFHSLNVLDGANTKWVAASSDTDTLDLGELDDLIKDL
jgi:hypothetical protein